MERFRTIFIVIRNILLGANILSIGLIGHPREFVGVVSTILFYFRTLTGKGRVEQRNPDEILPSDRKYVLKIDTDYYFWGSDPSYVKDILTLCILTRLTQARKIFEIGTLDGYTALHFAMNSTDDAEVCTLDLPQGGLIQPALPVTFTDKWHLSAHDRVKKYRFDGTPYERKVRCLFGDSATFDYRSFYGSIDLFFIDGAHSYEYVKSDTLNALKCVRLGGVIAWHDYGRAGVNGVSKYLHELSRSVKIYSVPGSALAYTIVEQSSI